MRMKPVKRGGVGRAAAIVANGVISGQHSAWTAYSLSKMAEVSPKTAGAYLSAMEAAGLMVMVEVDYRPGIRARHYYPACEGDEFGAWLEAMMSKYGLEFKGLWE